MPVIQPPKESQSMMTHETASSEVSSRDEINIQENQYSQMFVNDAMSNLNLKNKISSTNTGIVDSSSCGRVTRERIRGTIKFKYLIFNVLYTYINI